MRVSKGQGSGWARGRRGGRVLPLGRSPPAGRHTVEASLPLYLYESRVRRGLVYYLSLLGPSEVLTAGGLPRPAIVGLSHERSMLLPRSFSPNLLFLDLLHRVVARELPTDPVIVESARLEGEGSIEVWDGRSAEPGDDDALDEVLGCFRVTQGRLGAYRANPHYMLVSKVGLFELTPRLIQALLAELRDLRVPVVQVDGVH